MGERRRNGDRGRSLGRKKTVVAGMWEKVSTVWDISQKLIAASEIVELN